MAEAGRFAYDLRDWPFYLLPAEDSGIGDLLRESTPFGPK